MAQLEIGLDEAAPSIVNYVASNTIKARDERTSKTKQDAQQTASSPLLSYDPSLFSDVENPLFPQIEEKHAALSTESAEKEVHFDIPSFRGKGETAKRAFLTPTPLSPPTEKIRLEGLPLLSRAVLPWLIDIICDTELLRQAGQLEVVKATQRGRDKIRQERREALIKRLNLTESEQELMRSGWRYNLLGSAAGFALGCYYSATGLFTSNNELLTKGVFSTLLGILPLLGKGAAWYAEEQNLGLLSKLISTFVSMGEVSYLSGILTSQNDKKTLEAVELLTRSISAHFHSRDASKRLEVQSARFELDAKTAERKFQDEQATNEMTNLMKSFEFKKPLAQLVETASQLQKSENRLMSKIIQSKKA